MFGGESQTYDLHFKSIKYADIGCGYTVAHHMKHENTLLQKSSLIDHQL